MSTANPACGLALGGGGIRGAAHIGVLRVLDYEDIPIGAIAGTSMGALVGVLYGAGKRPDQIEAFIRQLAPEQMLRFDLLQRGLFQVARARELLVAELGDVRLESLSLPVAAVAVDVLNGEEVVLDRGSAVDAILASGAIAGLFAPVEIDGHLLVDGGVLNPIPVSVARALGAECVIAVDVCAGLALKNDWGNGSGPMGWLARSGFRLPLPWRNAFQVYSRSIALTTGKLAQVRLQLERPDIILRPAVGHYSLFQLSALRAAVAAGEAATRDALNSVRALTAPPDRSPGLALPQPLDEP